MIASIRKAASRLLPEAVKRLLRRPVIDKASGIAIGRFGKFDVAYRVGTADEAVLRHSFDRDIFFTGVPEYRSTPADVIIDVGAHIGTFSLLASSLTPAGRVLAIEASADTFALLRINIALNSCHNVSAHHLALTDHSGSATLFHDVGNWGHSIVSQLSSVTEEVECSTLENFLEANGVDEVAFLKLNCEGAEFPILMSSTGTTLRRFRLILALYHGDLWTANSELELTGHLQRHGFSVEIRQRDGRRGWIVAQRVD